MRKIFAGLQSTLLYLFASPALAFAAHIPTHTTTDGKIVNCPDNQFKAICDITASNFGATLGILVTFAFVAAIVIALVFLIYGGIKWITSGGDKTAIEESRNHIVAAIVGLVIVFLVYFILNLIIFFFTGESLFNLQIPTLKPTP